MDDCGVMAFSLQPGSRDRIEPIDRKWLAEAQYAAKYYEMVERPTV